MTDYEKLRERLLELSYLQSTLSVLHWDTQVCMPKDGSCLRANCIAYLTGQLHEKFLSLDADGLLSKLKNKLDSGELETKQAAIIRETWRDFQRESKLPAELVKEMAQVTSEGHATWAEAREQANYKKFQPVLERIIELKQKEATCCGYTNSLYDALIDSFEPSMTVEELTPLFQQLRDFLVPFVKQVATSPEKKKVLAGTFPPETQMTFNTEVAKQMGYNFDSGRIDSSVHPFSIGFNPQDVRITTRLDEHDIFYALDTTTHEVGHALYHQGFLVEHYGTPLAEPISYGIHESQSRMWENIIGRGRSFWRYYYPRLQSYFPDPFTRLDFEDFYCAINTVCPSLIRTEADEVTYNLHIVVRFEIEKGLIEGTINAADLPNVWQDKMYEYLNIEVPNDAVGVLQDVHWSSGYFGYFPSYALGNLYASQFYNAAEKAIPNLEDQIAQGKLQTLREWLRENIHMHGKSYSASDLILEVSGEPLNSQHFIDYITKKYGEIYDINQASNS